MPEFSDTALSWDEARDAFIARELVTPEEFAALEEYLRGCAWTIARIAELQTLDRVKRKLIQIIENGGTLAEFRLWLGDQALVWGRAYTELVFRQAVLGAYSRARWEEINDPDLGDEFGYLMYDAVNDDRTRESHAAMDNLTWEREDFPDEWWPPSGFNCRCEVRNLNEDLMRRAGGELVSGSPPDSPDEGFRSNQNRDYAGMLAEQLELLRTEIQE